jgi:hypothetical protein
MVFLGVGQAGPLNVLFTKENDGMFTLGRDTAATPGEKGPAPINSAFAGSRKPCRSFLGN